MSVVEGLFETIYVRNGTPLRLAEHLARLFRSAASLDLVVRDDPRELCQRCRGFPDGRMRLALENESVTVSVMPFPGYAEELYRDGATAILAEEPGHPLGERAGHKSLPYDAMIDARDLAKASGAIEVIFTDDDGALLEGSVSNLFVLKGRTLVTPPLTRPILPGVTRAAVLSLAPELGLQIREADLYAADLLNADEAFLTSSLKLALPLRRVGEVRIPLGPVTREIRNRLI